MIKLPKGLGTTAASIYLSLVPNFQGPTMHAGVLRQNPVVHLNLLNARDGMIVSKFRQASCVEVHLDFLLKREASSK